jgi:hypothetical protein
MRKAGRRWAGGELLALLALMELLLRASESHCCSREEPLLRREASSVLPRLQRRLERAEEREEAEAQVCRGENREEVKEEEELEGARGLGASGSVLMEAVLAQQAATYI